MPTTLFQVNSTRIHDINLAAGTTVGMLKDTLYAGGYDVRDSLITINRYAEGDKLIGQNESYVLSEGDTVEFTTRSCELTALRKPQPVKQEAPKAAPAAKQEEGVRVGMLEVVPVDGGFLVRIVK